MKKLTLLTGGLLLAATTTLGSACQATTGATTPITTTASPAAQATPQSPEDAMPRISVQEAKAAVEKGEAVIIDVRGTDAYRLSHIKDSLDHGLAKLEQSDFAGLPKDKRIIAYCSCPSEHSSARAAYVLQKAGFKDAAALVGGNMAWEAAGFEMVKAPPATPLPAATAAPKAAAQPKASKK